MITTKPIPLFVATDAVPGTDHLRGLMSFSRCPRASTCDIDTLPLLLGTGQPCLWKSGDPTGLMVSNLQPLAVAVFIALRRAMADDEISRPLGLPDLGLAWLCQGPEHTPPPVQVPFVARVVIDEDGDTFVEQEEASRPLEFEWTKARRKIRAAARAYSEQTHADY